MPIDSARKRKSASSIRPFRRAYGPTSGIGTPDDRAQIVGTYVRGAPVTDPAGLIESWIPMARITQWIPLER